MAASTAIADVSQTLLDVLSAGLAPLGTTAVLSDLQAPPGPGNFLSIFLYLLREDSHAKNRPPFVSVSGMPPAATVTRPPVALSVHYLFTPWSASDIDNHRILGQVMQTLHDHAIVSGAELRGSLALANEELHLSVVPLTLEDQLRVWHALSKPYRLSITYEARVVRIDSTVATGGAVVRERGLAPAEQRVTP